MARTVEFFYYLICTGMLIAGLHLADAYPWMWWMAVIGWPILIAVSVWLVGWYLPTQRGWRDSWSVMDFV
jgi:membrane protein implicated in regulation of membrane protease activity